LTRIENDDNVRNQLFTKGNKVKTIFSLACISIVIISTNVFGQSSIEGVKVGLNFANITGSEITNALNNQSITAFNAGVFTTFDIAGLLVVQPELLYTMKGYKLTEKGVSNSGFLPPPNLFVTGNNSYLEIPVLLKINVPSFSLGIIRPNIFAGPEVAFGLSSKVKIQSADPTEPQGSAEFTYSRPTDFGIIFGAGADVNLPTITFILDVRYDLGMKSLDFAPFGPSQIKNNVLTLNAGIGI
jgi:hypothetical protein